MALISIQRYIIIDVFWFISGYIDNFIIFCRFMYFFISSLKQLILKTNHFKHKNNCGFNKKVIDIKVLKTFQFSSVLSLWRFLYFNHSVNASRVHRGCVLNIFSERYLIDLVPIPLGGSKAIVGMEWLGSNRAICGEGAQHGPMVFSTARSRRYLQQVCSGFLAYVVDM